MSKPVTLDLEQNHTLLLRGPAWIRAKRGDAQCLGARIQSDDWTLIEEARQEPIYAADNTLLEIIRGSGSSWSVIEESTVPVAWNEAAQVSFFIGDTSPSLVPDKVVNLATRLKKQMTRSADIVLVNTDGWLAEFNALRHKQHLIEEIQPDVVIALSRSDEVIDPLLERVKFASLKLPSSSFARVRSKEERKKARDAEYRRFLQASHKLGIGQETKARMFDQLEQTVFPENRRFRGLVAGLLNQNEELLSIARINQVGNGRVVVETKTIEKPTILEIGNVVLSSKYDEVGYGTLH